MALLLNAGDTVSRSYSYTQPSPLHPSLPEGTGERTGNLFDAGTVTTDYYVNDENGNIVKNGNYNVNASDYININGLSSIYLSTHGAAGLRQWAAFYDNAKTYISGINGYNRAVSVPNNATYLRVTVHDTYLNNFSVVSGNTAPMTYEPYGYKIPISSAGQITPVYLGEVESTRRIKKLVLTGQETRWNKSGAYQGSFYLSGVSPAPISLTEHAYCSHVTFTTLDQYTRNTFCFNGRIVNLNLWIGESSWTTDDFKTYLQQQYAAGTPVTIWYVLATEETAVVNEPLMRISDYADTLSNVSIPVTAGGDTLSIGTTVQPSEVTVNYKGWHPVADVHERDNGAWT